MHPLLLIIDTHVFRPGDLSIKNLIAEKESKEYGACEFELNQKRTKFRVAKITPTKVGQFVTIWKREGNGPIMPFDMADSVDFFMIAVQWDEKLGLFIFPKSVLHQKGYVSLNGRGGKRAMRMYSTWDMPHSPIAKETQAWQLQYFIEVNPPRKSFDKGKIHQLVN